MDKKELVEIINSVLDAREERKREKIPHRGPDVPLQSENIEKVCAALANMQTESTTIFANKINSHFKSKYADINDVLEVITPLLSKYKLALIQREEEWEQKEYLRTILKHTESKEYIASYVKMRADNKAGPQGYGSSMTYHRRYSACCLLGISIDKDDDDGEKATGRNIQKENKVDEKSKVEPLLSVNEVEYIEERLANSQNERAEILRFLKKRKFEECSKSWFDDIVTAVDKVTK